MTSRYPEERSVHTRLLKCALEVDDSRAYWQHALPGVGVDPELAFGAWWFGTKSLDGVRVLLTNLRARFDAFPPALSLLHTWPDMTPSTRVLICHWHLQLSDPLYRSFSGDYLPNRRSSARPEVTRDRVTDWVAEQGPGRWTLPTRIQFASKLLSCAFSAGIVGTNRDPRPILYPRVEDDALTYMLYLLREVDFEGTFFENPYFRSVGLEGALLEDRLRSLVGLRRQGDLLDFDWPYPDLSAWARARGFGASP